MPNTVTTAAAWHDETTIPEIPDFAPNTPDLVAARDRYEAAAVVYYARRDMARAARCGAMSAQMMADDLLCESADVADDEELRAQSERAEADLAREQREEAHAHAKGRAARKELDEAAAALRELLVAAPQA